MAQEIKTVRLLLPLRFGTVNCYLVRTDSGYFLIDTGSSNQRAVLERELTSAGCRPGDLKLILITHGDFDHIANAAHLRAAFGARIAMHPDDAGMAEHGDMFWNRKRGNFLLRRITPILFRFAKADRFKPDIYIEDGYDLSGHGWPAHVVHLPGHSKGSIGILTAGGDLFCGDLFDNTDEPALSSIMDDLEAARASAQKLRSYEIHTVYPGHGQPFPIDALTRSAGR